MPMKTRCDELCDLVLARCDEDLSWISTAARNYQRVRLYNKCRSPVPSDVRRLANLRVIETPNIGSNDFAILNHVITNFNDLAPLTVFCEAGQPSVCEPNMVVRPLGLTKRWPVPYAPLAQFAAKPPYTFNPWKHHMDLGGFSSRWWGNCSYGYVHTPGRSHQFISSGYDNYAAWLRHTLGADLATDLLSNRKAYLVLQVGCSRRPRDRNGGYA
jgi:hypothetical protein